MAQLDKTFPTNDCAMCIMSPKLVEVGRHLNIDILTTAVLEDIQGEPGNFKVKIRQRPRYVKIEACTGCGDCANRLPGSSLRSVQRGPFRAARHLQAVSPGHPQRLRHRKSWAWPHAEMPARSTSAPRATWLWCVRAALQTPTGPLKKITPSLPCAGGCATTAVKKPVRAHGKTRRSISWPSSAS
jgi:NAD-dependent dihydropyrimidine dehydrogenase PreA subunit